MKTYEIYLEENSYGFVTVEAESREEALDKAEDMYFEGQVNWTGGDWNTLDCKEIQE